jgi:hypothetical protein
MTVTNAKREASFCGLSGVRKQVGKGFILVDRPQFIAHAHEHIPFRIGSTGDTSGSFWNGAELFGFE